ncbi:hypothetical protein EJ04DRAFT_441788 [Polyplosphaeria fusca]|uniref:Uncharacterized protein n=1 Tax=Polyplosphaeria fusca TaxID=682080 RepID=A0A9P4QVE5_9PLEO|nr:hypothetical protein EJ04DRAFT_441788 [Polyplosphaeria fusca]
MADPDRGWKPNNRPQSTMARNFLSELDDLFKINGSIDDLDNNVHQKKQAVTTHSQELEALEARLRETEARLQQAKTSPPSGKHSQRPGPLEGTVSANDRVTNRQRPAVNTRNTKDMPGAQPDTPTSYNSTEYVLVDRPHTGQSQGEKA